MSSSLRRSVEASQSTRSIQGKRKLRKPRKVPRALSTRPLEVAYRREILAFLEQLQVIVNETLVPELPTLERMSKDTYNTDTRLDAATYASLVQRFFNKMSTQWGESIGFVEGIAKKAGLATSQRNYQSIRRQIRGSLSVDPLISDPDLAGVMDLFAVENVSLIKSIGSEHLKNVQREVFGGFRSGMRVQDIENTIKERFKVSREKARLIATDQIQKLNGQLTETRNRGLGITAYFWDTSQDSRVRKEHAARQGKRFLYTEPPFDGHPGQAVRCRCNQIPDLEGLL